MTLNVNETKYVGWLQYANLTQVVHFSTHMRGNGLSRTLDLVFYQEPGPNSSVGRSSAWNFGCSRRRFIPKEVILLNKDGQETLERPVALAPWFLCTDVMTDFTPWDLF